MKKPFNSSPNKIKSLMNKKSSKDSEKVYNQIFKNPSWYVKTKLKARGIHDVIANNFYNLFANKDVLDLGCGYGRFSFIIDKFCNSVTGIDRNKKSISVAKDLKKYFDNCNVNFINTSIENFNTKIKFDFILLSGTLEHIVDTNSLAKKVSELLKKGGVFVSDSPSEFNIRGMVHGGLWKLFDFPMTLTDVDIITPNKMKNIFFKHNIIIDEKTIGTQFSRGWGENALFDLVERLPKVQKDLINKNQKMKLNEFFEWYTEGNKYFRNLYEMFYEKKLLKKIKPFKNRKNPINLSTFVSKYISTEDAFDYFEPNFQLDPYYSKNLILSNLSGNIIYHGKKI